MHRRLRRLLHCIGAPCRGENKIHQVRLHVCLHAPGKGESNGDVFWRLDESRATFQPIEGKYAYPAIPEHFEFGKWCAALLSRLTKNNTLSVTPIRVVPNGLADAQYWIDYQEEGKASQTIKLCSVIY